MVRLLLLVFSFALFFRSPGFSQYYNQVIITEIMADPSPVKGLPDVEYLELYNRSGKVVSLNGWKLLAGTRSAILPDAVLDPGEYALICNKNSVTAMSGYGQVIGINALTLTNNGMLLGLYNQNNQLVFSVYYVNKWWTPDKNEGGFSIEMTDTCNPCGDVGNWQTSIHSSGGTPGQKSSAAKPNADILSPVVRRIEISENKEIVVVFNEKVDSLNAVLGAITELSGRKIVEKQLESPFFTNLILTPDLPLLDNQEYQLRVRNIADCAGNLLRESSHRIALPSPADSTDVVLNEILFNPRTGGVDFVELYNRSLKYISLKNWSLGNLKDNEPNLFSVITTDNVSMPPNSYLALTADEMLLREQYPAVTNQEILEMSSFPAYSNTEGGVVLKDNTSRLLDRFSYNEKMHHALLTDYEGISLERIDLGKSPADPANWQSAAATVGFATPGYANSQARPEVSGEDFVIEPEAFTPDNDGLDDYAAVQYRQSLSGRIATIRIYSTNGQLVKTLISNQLIGTSGIIRWDGTNDTNLPAGIGLYLFLIETFDITGTLQQYKKKVVLARKGR